MAKKILFLLSPNITLFQPKLYQELSLGSAMVAGALEHHGFEVDFYDLNAALTKIRGEEYLSEGDKSVLTNDEQVIAEVHGAKTSMWVQRWLDHCMELVGDVKRYDAVAISMDKVGFETFMSRGTLHFANLLAAEIRKRTTAIILAGGKELIKDVGINYARKLADRLAGRAIDYYFTRNSHGVFPVALKNYFNGEGPLHGNDRFIVDNSLFRQSNFTPKYDVINKADLFVEFKDLFPEDLIRQEPRLRDQDPLTLIPYRHTLGCPYKCTFCQSGKDTAVRTHSADDVVHHLTVLRKKGFENYRWYNDNVNLGPIFPVQLAEKIIEANIGIFFSDSANMIHTSEKILGTLAKAGCVKLWFGAETLSPKLLLQNNKQATVEDVYRTLQTAQKFGIWSGLYLILAFPHETVEDYMLTHNFIKDRTDLYDCIEVNIFRLLANTYYASDPEKYNLRIRAVADNGRIAAYDEIGGMCWEERVPESERRLEMLWSIYSFDKTLFFQNDYLLYALLRSGLSKAETKLFMQNMYGYLLDNGSLADYMLKINRYIGDDRRIRLGPTIVGRLIADTSKESITEFRHTPY